MGCDVRLSKKSTTNHIRFRRLTLRSATGTAQRACPYLESVGTHYSSFN
jgi:hypothetical protein